MRSHRSAVTVLLLGAALLAGCGADDDSPDTAATTTVTASSSTGGSSGSSPAGAAGSTGAGCPANGYALTGTNSAPTLDVDGDGAVDTAWIATQPTADGSVQFGVQTASGGVLTGNIQSASPIARSVLVADVTGEGELVALASDGRQALLYALSDCEIVPVQNAQGEQYAFDLGFTGYGTGVGCVDVDGDGTRDLVGLQVDGDGTGVTSTVVTLDGPRATNSDVSVSVADAGPAAVELARQVTCGDLSLDADGVTSGP